MDTLAVYTALWANDLLRTLEYSQIAVTVDGNRAILRGHVTVARTRQWAGQITRQVPGIDAVENHLVDDETLVNQVCLALMWDTRTVDEIIQVSAHHGIVVLSGTVSGAAVRAAAEECAAGVAEVRAVSNYLQAPGVAVSGAAEEALQPPINAQVIATDWVLGRVAGVIIDPHNRRVTGLVIHGTFSDPVPGGHYKSRNGRNGMTKVRSVVIPRQAVREITPAGVWLRMSAGQAARYPDFDPACLRRPEMGWHPPYPYEPGDVWLDVRTAEQTARWAPDGAAKGVRSGHGESRDADQMAGPTGWVGGPEVGYSSGRDRMQVSESANPGENAMKTDMELRDDVLEELRGDCGAKSVQIGVAVKHGVVTLSGTAGSYAEKAEAVRAAQRLAGVRAVAADIEVEVPGGPEGTDTDIAQAAADVLTRNVNVPAGKIKVLVENGWITLSGEVDRDNQKEGAESAVGRGTGAKGVSNQISVKSGVTSDDIKTRIEQALERSARADAQGITVETRSGQVTLRGSVRSWAEREEAEQAAWAEPGVSDVYDHIAIRP